MIFYGKVEGKETAPMILFNICSFLLIKQRSWIHFWTFKKWSRTIREYTCIEIWYYDFYFLNSEI